MCVSVCVPPSVSLSLCHMYNHVHTGCPKHTKTCITRVDSKNPTRPLWRLALVPGDLEGHNQSLLKAMGALIKSHENLRKQVD